MGSVEPRKGIKIAIDRGGTFTDVLGIIPGQQDFICKLLSVDPSNYKDATIEGIRRVLCHAQGKEIPRGELLDTTDIEVIRMGTTVATNALLERKGSKCALLITKGFKDLMAIGNQTRPKLFDLNIRKPGVLHEKVVEVDERVTLEAYTEDPKQQSCLEFVDGKEVVTGVTGEAIRILKPLDVTKVTEDLTTLRNEGFESIAVCLAHGYNFQDHEQKIGEIATKIGFNNISLSSSLLPMIKMTSRGQSTTADAYLTPETKKYVNNFIRGFKPGFEQHTSCEFMQSDGGLVSYDKFNGLRAILSGPAGGVVGYARTSYDENERTPAIGFDMGGTSTDVSRYGGQYEHVFESVTAGVHINCAQLDINTVAAGGGSMLFWRGGLFVVGPESAGAHPGPACYRKGGPLTVTDANLLLGRLLPEYFPKIFGPNENEPLGIENTREAFEKLALEINVEIAPKTITIEEIALGFLNVANINMAKPIRALTESRGFDTTAHNLASFGGAGGQHACDIAEGLGIKRVIIHRYSSILSAYGMALADLVSEAQEPSSKVYNAANMPEFLERLETLKSKVEKDFVSQGISKTDIEYETYLNMRYQGSDSKLMIRSPESGQDYLTIFLKTHQREFSFTSADRDVIVDDIRVRGTANSNKVIEQSPFEELNRVEKNDTPITKQSQNTQVYFQSGWQNTPVFLLGDLTPGDVVKGPAMIIDQTQTLVVIPNATATILSRHVIIDLELGARKNISSDEVDPVQLSIFGHRFMSIAEDMGRTLQKISVSTNVKERLDFSCALFDSEGGLTANAPHVPVHLGSMSAAVCIAMDYWKDDLEPGDVIATNHPMAGGTHLPDITIISPVFDSNGKDINFWVASRAHHAEIGGIAAGSMPSNSTELWQEGAAFEQWKMISKGKFDDAGVQHHFIDVPGSYPGSSPSRCVRDNIADMKAQVAANQVGINLIQAMFEEYNRETVLFYMHAVKKTAETAVRQLLRDTAKKYAGQLPLTAVDHMDDGTAIKLTISIDEVNGEALFDFTGTGHETYNSFNAPAAITRSAILYSLRCLIDIDIPLNQGCLIPITIKIPPGTLLNPSPTAAVCAGNGPTSQRITDVILKAFQACAASCGDMSFVSFGIGGLNSQGVMEPGFGFGEALAGGSGAGPGWNGTSGVQIHMTNTKITDPEIFEKRYPIILHRFEYRTDSSGAGEYYGGEGLLREIEYRIPVHVSVLTQRRVYSPYGMAGGEDGGRGENLLGRKMPDGTLRWVNVGGTKEIEAKAGDRIRICSPGGGGYGCDMNKDDKCCVHCVRKVAKMNRRNVSGSQDEQHAPTLATRANGSLNHYANMSATSF